MRTLWGERDERRPHPPLSKKKKKAGFKFRERNFPSTALFFFSPCTLHSFVQVSDFNC